VPTKAIWKRARKLMLTSLKNMVGVTCVPPMGHYFKFYDEVMTSNASMVQLENLIDQLVYVFMAFIVACLHSKQIVTIFLLIF
jgi:hypothetical protein